MPDKPGRILIQPHSATLGEFLLNAFAGQFGSFHSFTAVVAFVKQSGTQHLVETIEKWVAEGNKVKFIVGTDHRGTSKEGLEDLMRMIGRRGEVWVSGVAEAHITFHPKVYLFEGDAQALALIGSHNLTQGGLFTNDEAAAIQRLDLSVKEDRETLRSLKEAITNWSDPATGNARKLTKRVLARLLKDGIVVTESESSDEGKETKSQTKSSSKKSVFKKSAVKRKAPSVKRHVNKPKKSLPVVGVATARGRLVWSRRSLPASSVQQPSRTGTNPTGGLRLVQADFQVRGKAIDQTKYFRILFRSYRWQTASTKPFVETAQVLFEITIRGKYVGRHTLTVRHKPSGEAGQHNYTTSVSWGELGETIRKAALTGARLDLYAPANPGEPFHIVIS